MNNTIFTIPENMPHILVVDDDNRLRDLLGQYLEDQGWFVTSAENASDARTKLAFFAFDLMVLDVMMPNETGLEFTHSLQDTNHPPILMLTAMSESEDKILGLESGVDDYLTKPFEPRELILRIRNILKRTMQEKAVRNNINFGEFNYDTENHQLYCNDELVHLTMSESRLLKTLITNKNEPISRTILAEQSQGTIANDRTVDVQINRLRRKIEQDPSRPIYIQTVRGAGYILKL